MAMLVDDTTRVLIQGITGREGRARASLMKRYGTDVVAGVTPGRGGQVVEGIPVFDTVREAWEQAGPLDASVIFVPAPLVLDAALEAIDAGIRLLVIVPDRVPLYDVLEIIAAADRSNACFIGPNTLGVLNTGRAVLGMIGGQVASAQSWFLPGPVGIVSRSGGMTTSAAYYLAKEGIGTSTLVHVGGDMLVGLPLPSMVERFETDPETEAVVLFGEIGTSQEEQVADLIEAGRFTKPLIAYLGGKAAKDGTRFSHAGAIIEGGRGTYQSKISRLRGAGAHIAPSLGDIPRIVGGLLQQSDR
ncbi:MAG: CoA-binding protein [Trueperaceae bacterium]|nr:MAG: CoA-binding protein [Trueperaceae bacterium]